MTFGTTAVPQPSFLGGRGIAMFLLLGCPTVKGKYDGLVFY